MTRIITRMGFLCLLVMLVTGHTYAQQGKKIAELEAKLEQAVLDTQKVNILNLLSFEIRKIDTLKAYRYASQALKLSVAQSYPSGEAAAYTNMGEYFRIKGDMERALESFSKGLDIYSEIGAKRESCKLYNKIGVVYQTLADYDKALENFHRSLEINKEIDDKEAIAGVYNNIGINYYLLGQYERAHENYIASLKIREQLGDKGGMAASYNNIGNINYEQGNYDRALEYYMRGIQIKEELKDAKGLINSYNNIGELYCKLNDPKKAMQYYEKAQQACKGAGDDGGQALVFTSIGNLLRDDKKYAQAIENYSQAKNIYSKMGDKRGIAVIYNSLGKLYVGMGNYGSAIPTIGQALDIASDIGAKDEMRNAYSNLAQAYEGIGDYKQANDCYRKFMAIKDSLFTEQSAKMITEMETKYRTGKKQGLIDLLKKENELKDMKYRVFTYAWMGGALMLLVLAIVVVVNNRQKQRVNSMLTEQNRKISRQKEEKEVLLKEVHHRVKNNLQVICSLLNIQSAHIMDPEMASLFTDCQNRVRSMALIHEKLYTAADLSKVELHTYVESLAQSLLSTYQLNNNITLDLQLSVKSFGVNTLIPVGLLLNELISNSLKHGFSDEADNGMIMIKLGPLKEKDHHYEMIVGDNGKGMPYELLRGQDASLGLELIYTFVEQLEGTIERMPEPGTVFRIIFVDIDAVHGRRREITEVVEA